MHLGEVKSRVPAAANFRSDASFSLTASDSGKPPRGNHVLTSAPWAEATQTEELRVLDMVFETAVFEMLEVITDPA
jgi:hypothetical protein